MNIVEHPLVVVWEVVVEEQVALICQGKDRVLSFWKDIAWLEAVEEESL